MRYALLICATLCTAAHAAEPTTSPVAAPTATDLQPAVNTSVAPVAAPTAGKPAASGTRRAKDRLDLDETRITGNRELPRVMYVVPWKRADLGDLTGRPANSLLDEVLSPVDRDVFRRQNRYYDALKPDTTSDSAGKGTEVEK
jgi:hypothetical protein